MNAPHQFTDTVPATREHELRVLVERILADDYTGIPKVEWEYYGRPDWRDAAEYAAEAQDYSDIEHMLTKERLWQGWMRLSDAEQELWADDFENYLSARSEDRFVTSLDAQIGVARKAMGEPRWQQLNREFVA